MVIGYGNTSGNTQLTSPMYAWKNINTGYYAPVTGSYMAFFSQNGGPGSACTNEGGPSHLIFGYAGLLQQIDITPGASVLGVPPYSLAFE
jgi:hypothetical protein